MAGGAVSVADLISPFFEQIGSGFRATLRRGQIYWAATYYPHENLEVWRPKRMDPASGQASDFEPVSGSSDTFKRQAPLTTPRLKTNEEFIVVRAKIRPVILLADLPPDSRVTRMRGGGVIDRHFAICAPMYSIDQKETEQPKFRQDFIDRLLLAEYPHLFYTPPHAALQGRRSFVRLDSLQPVFRGNLDAIDLRLSEEALALVDSQYLAHTLKRDDGVYTEYRRQLFTQS